MTPSTETDQAAAPCKECGRAAPRRALPPLYNERTVPKFERRHLKDRRRAWIILAAAAVTGAVLCALMRNAAAWFITFCVVASALLHLMDTNSSVHAIRRERRRMEAWQKAAAERSAA